MAQTDRRIDRQTWRLYDQLAQRGAKLVKIFVQGWQIPQVISEGGQLWILVHRKVLGVARMMRHPVQDTGLQDSKLLETMYTAQYLLPSFKRRKNKQKYSTAQHITLTKKIQIQI